MRADRVRSGHVLLLLLACASCQQAQQRAAAGVHAKPVVQRFTEVCLHLFCVSSFLVQQGVECWQP